MEVVDRLESYEPTRGKAVTLRSPGSSQLLELNWYEEGSRFGTAYMNGEELDHLGFEVEDLEDAVKRLEEEGVEVVVRPGTIGGWREAFVKDLDGIWSSERNPLRFFARVDMDEPGLTVHSSTPRREHSLGAREVW